MPKTSVVAVQTTCLDPDQMPDAARRILFIGNSHTFGNGSIPVLLRQFSPDILAAMVAIGGCTLHRHWHEGPARSILNDARFKWDSAVLQENGWWPSKAPDDSFEYARNFKAEIERLGAKPVWFMTHPYHKFARDHKNAEGHLDSAAMYENSRALAERVAGELAITVAPVGDAWWAYQQSTAEKADTRDLYKDDGIHATAMGTYLSACVFYAVLLGKSPVGLSPIGFEQAGRIQKIVADVCGV